MMDKKIKPKEPGGKVEIQQIRRRRISQISKINLDIYIDKIKKNKKYNEDEKVVLVRHKRNEAQKKKAIEDAIKAEELRIQLEAIEGNNTESKKTSLEDKEVDLEYQKGNCDPKENKNQELIEIEEEETIKIIEEEFEEKDKGNIVSEEDNKTEELKGKDEIKEKEAIEEIKVIEKELPEEIDDLMKIIDLKKANPDQEIIEYNGKFYKV